MSTTAKSGFLALLLIALMLVAAVGHAADGDGIEVTEGQIHELDHASGVVVISGVSYVFAVDVKVEIAGTFGAPTMLTTGMNVSVQFRRWDDGRREITEMSQLPSGVEPTLY